MDELRELSFEELDVVSGGASSVNQQAFPPGLFPSGNPSTAPGNSNDPGNSG